MAEQAPLKWAFQTKGEFKVVSSLPRDRSAGVPADTGIEISFSHLNFGNVREYFEIEPHVEGSFAIHKKTAVFVPKKLEPATLYTVTLKKGLPLEDSEEVLQEDYSFQFETQEEQSDAGKFNLNFFKNSLEFTTAEVPVFPLWFYAQDRAHALEVDAAIYRYPDAGGYIKALRQKEQIPYWAINSLRSYREDTSNLDRAGKFSTSLHFQEGMAYLAFPEPLPSGYYTAEVSFQEMRSQLWFQVSDLGIYAAVADNQTVFWVNDLLAGAPVPGAEIKLEPNSGKAVTDQRGLARIAAPVEDNGGLYAVISQENRETVAAVFPNRYRSPEQEKEYKIEQSYWKYLYLDRGLYKPDDTIHFWGLVKPREPGREAPEEVSLVLAKWGGWRGDFEIANQVIKLENFTLTDRIDLPNLAPGYYNLFVKIGENVIARQGFAVETYIKPAYRLEVEPDRKALFAGDTVDFQITATFFEGTGASKLPLNYHLYETNGQIVTDTQGQAVLPYTPQYQGSSYYPFQYRELYLNADLPESGEITGRAPVMVLNNDVLVEAVGKVEKGTARVELVLHKLTVDKVNRGESDSWNNEAFFDGTVPDHQLTARVYHDYWEKKEAGEYYDFINKKVRKRYQYLHQEIFVTEGQITTDEEGKALFNFPAGEDKSYRVQVSTTDFRGNPAVMETHVRGPQFYREYDYQWYHLQSNHETGKYRPGETVSLALQNNQQVMPARQKGFMFLTARAGIMEVQVQDQGLFSTVFQEEWIPNFWVKGIYFDGRHYHDTPEYLAAFDEQQKSLNVEVKTDQEEYRPGDTVKVTVQVRDQKGSPVQAGINLNLVDEALYALRDQHADLLRSLYGDLIRSGIRETINTHQAPVDGGLGAEHGGEGESERKDFKDAVFFDTVTTEKNGQVQVSFQVPDNLTSWRLTYQVLTKNLEAASGTTNVKVKLPFFVEMILNDTYLTGDQPVIPVRCFGSNLKERSEIRYTSKLKLEGEEIKNITLTGKAFEMVELPLPALKKGSYELTLTGTTLEGLTDTLSLPFQVVDTAMSQQQTDFYQLDSGTVIKGAGDSLTHLTISDYERSQYLHLLWRLAGVGGSRIEQKLTSVRAKKLLQEYFPQTREIYGEDDLNLLSYQTPEGGIAILPYAGADPELTAKTAALYREGFDASLMADYFQQILYDPEETRERGLTALYGLASLGEPVLQELKLVAAQADLTVKERLYLILALIETGDGQRAAWGLQSLLKDHGEETGAFLRINTGEDQDDILEATALTAVAASALNLPEQNKLQQYLLENRTADILTYLEQLLFLQEVLPRMPEKPVSFSYALDDGSRQVSLKPGETFSLLLTPEKLSRLMFSEIQGKVGVTAVYMTEFNPFNDLSSDGVKITRSYSTQERVGGEFRLNDLVKVNITYQFGNKVPEGMYRINDYLPAGLKIVPRPFSRGIEHHKSLRYPVEINGQKAVFLVSGGESNSFHYYARVINGGAFRAEQAALQHTKSGKTYGVTEEDRVIIQ